MAGEAVKQALQLGKKFRCPVCNTEVLCTKSGSGPLICCEQEMQSLAPQPPPATRVGIVPF